MSDDLRPAPGRPPAPVPGDEPPPGRSPLRLVLVSVRAGVIGGLVFWILALTAGDPGPFQDGIRFAIGFTIFVFLVLLLRGPPEAPVEERPRW